MDLFSSASTAAAVLLHGLFVFGLMKIKSQSFRHYLILYSTCMSAFSVAIALCDISMASSPQMAIVIAQGPIRGLLGVGVYLGLMTIVLVVLLTLPVFRYCAIKRNWLYLHMSSTYAFAPYFAFTALVALLIYGMPAFFFKPENATIEAAVPLLKQKFGLARDHGYMAMIAYYEGGFEKRWKAYLGMVTYCLFMLTYFIIGIIFTAKIRNEVVGRNRSKKRRFLENRHLICFWSQTLLITLLDLIPRLVCLMLPLFSVASDAPDDFTQYAAPLLPVFSALAIIYTVPELYIHIVKTRGKGVAPSVDVGTSNTNDP